MSKFIWGPKPSAIRRARRLLKRVKKVVEIRIDAVVLIETRRPLNERRLKSLTKSIENEGQQQPIQVYALEGIHKGKFGLSAGNHRLTAMKRLGYQTILANVLSRADAKVWLPSENIHRADSRALDYSEDIVRYRIAVKEKASPNVLIPNGGRQPNDRGISKLAKAMGIDRKRIADAFRHDRLPIKVKRAIRKLKLDNNRNLLNTVADLEGEREQLTFLKAQSVTRPRRRIPVKESLAALSLDALDRRWRKCSFRKVLEQQNEDQRKAFARRHFGL